MKRTNIAGFAGLLSAALLVSSCDESRIPTVPVSGVTVFDAQPGPPVLDQKNGTLGFSGTDIRKGFNPYNPQHGDAIIATFIWQGSTNVIASVRDELTNGTQVGNTYNLVEYKTAGGISMATYVALDVQNFPQGNLSDPNPDQSQILVVVATLSQPITQGGIMLSAYKGVALASALTGHASAGGTSSTTTTASTGPITPGDGSLIYSVSFSSPNASHSPPAGFNEITNMSTGDGVVKIVGQWAVHSGTGTADPTWTWFHTQSSAWLLTNVALLPNGGGPPPPTTGDLTATTSTSGADLDPDGYTVTVDGGASQAIGVNGTVTFPGLAAGDHAVALSGVAGNCSVTSANPQTVSVPSGGTASATFSINCSALPPPTGDLNVSASTSGSSLDPNGYTVTVDGGSSQALSINGSVTFTGLSEGTHSVALSGVASNCSVSGANPRTISVPAGGTANTTFSVTCVTPNTAPVVNAGPDETVLTSLLFTETWSFTDPDNGPWSFTIDWGDGTYSSGTKTSPGTFNNGHNYGPLLRTYTIRITVTDSMGASYTDTKKVMVVLF